MKTEVELKKELWMAVWKLFWSSVDLPCLCAGVGLLIYAVFMTPEYAGEQHNLQIIGMLLLILGARK